MSLHPRPPCSVSYFRPCSQIYAFKDVDIGIGIRYQTDASIFNLRRLKAKTKVKFDTINEFLFADDVALKAASEADMQCSNDKFSDACNNFGFTISTKKTEVMHQPAPGKPYSEPNIYINGQLLNAVDLGNTHRSDARLAKASAAFGRLQTPQECF